MGLLSRIGMVGAGAAGVGGLGYGIQQALGSNVIDAMKRKQEISAQLKSQNPALSDQQIQQMVEQAFAAENRRAMGLE